MLSHIVYFTLNDSSAEACRDLVDACHKYLNDHPGTVFFAAGTRAEEFDRPVNDQAFHVALHVIFESSEAHDAYQEHERHQEFIEQEQSNWAQVRVFDSWVR